MVLWVIAGVLGIAIIAALALRLAISANGPAVLNAVDRITGGTQGAVRLAEISTGDHAQQKLIVWGPQSAGDPETKRPVLIFFHGGSWANGDPVDYGFIARAYVPEGFVVVLAGYRLGEEGRYPAMLDDTAAAIAWTHGNIADFGGHPARIVVAGHSAGAYNVVQAALEDQWLARRGLERHIISGVIGLSGPYDFAPFISPSTIATFGHVDHPAATQPITHVRANAPQMLLVHGSDDTLVRPRNSAVLADTLNAAGGHALYSPMAGMEHNTPLIHHAAPWRRNAKLIELTAGFAHTVSQPVDAPQSAPADGLQSSPSSASQEHSGQTSVSVQVETG